MNQIPHCDWLPERTRRSDTACLGLTVLLPLVTFRQSPSGCQKVFFHKIFSVTVERFSVIFLSGWN